MLVAFNSVKTLKPMKLMNEHEIMEMTIWGNEYFKVNEECLFFKNWIAAGYFYIKSLIDKNGKIKSDDVFYESIVSWRDFYHQMFIIRKYVLKKVKCFQTGIAPYVKI